MVHTPDIETCRMGATGKNKEIANLTNVGNDTSCSSLTETFIKFQPDFIHFVFEFKFELPENVPDVIEHYNDYAVAEAFGVVRSEVEIVKYFTTGKPFK